MSETFFEKWKHRISSAWAVLTGQAFAAYYTKDCFTPWPDDSHQ